MVSAGKIWDFPDGPVVKNLPSNAGDAGLIPGWGTKISHAEGQLTEAQALQEKILYDATKTRRSQIK